MAKCARCCLYQSMRAVNLILNLCGIGMIIYSLWLEKKWNQGVKELISTSGLPRPWFIYTCLGVGIVVCLTTLAGHMVANCVTNSVLCIYLVAILSLLLIQGMVIVSIFFKMDLASEITEAIDDSHMKLRSFLIFHLIMCRWIVTMVTVVQLNVVILAVILWAVGFDSRGHGHSTEQPDFRHSFLDVSSSTIRLYLLESFRKHQHSDESNENVDQAEMMSSSQSFHFTSWLKDFFSFNFSHRPSSTSN
uniref:Tetraspanin-19-like n=1 Tax=Kalanchoe fedtschenkoi TaxID=63787 RepID=A0A7N0TLP8_KALFE